MRHEEKTELVESFQESILLIKVDYLHSFNTKYMFLGPLLTDGRIAFLLDILA